MDSLTHHLSYQLQAISKTLSYLVDDVDGAVLSVFPFMEPPHKLNLVYQKPNKDVSSTDILHMLERFRTLGLKASVLFIDSIPQPRKQRYV